MAKVKRIYVEKKEEYAAEARGLQEEISGYLGVKGLDRVRLLNRYDCEGISDEVFEKAVNGIFSEPPVDDYYLDSFKSGKDDFVFSVEYLPGQFDQRADSAAQCIMLTAPENEPVIRLTFLRVSLLQLTRRR